jgi:hypothetical protein
VKAVGALEEASAAVREMEGRSAGLPFAEAEALQGAYDARLEAFEGALRRVLRAPAPDVGAFATKIVLAIDHDVASLAGGAACLKAVRRDAMAFARSDTSNEG